MGCSELHALPASSQVNHRTVSRSVCLAHRASKNKGSYPDDLLVQGSRWEVRQFPASWSSGGSDDHQDELPRAPVVGVQQE